MIGLPVLARMVEEAASPGQRRHGSAGAAAARTRTMGAPTNPPAPATMMLKPVCPRSMPDAFLSWITFDHFNSLNVIQVSGLSHCLEAQWSPLRAKMR
jgi:hypothetical protein